VAVDARNTLGSSETLNHVERILMCISSKCLLSAAVGAVGVAAGALYAPAFLGSISPSSPIRRVVEGSYRGIERLGLSIAHLLDPDKMIIAPSDSSVAYRLFLLFLCAVVGAILGVVCCAIFEISMKFVKLRRSQTRK
jgi:hypothetical protein